MGSQVYQSFPAVFKIQKNNLQSLEDSYGYPSRKLNLKSEPICINVCGSIDHLVRISRQGWILFGGENVTGIRFGEQITIRIKAIHEAGLKSSHPGLIS